MRRWIVPLLLMPCLAQAQTEAQVAEDRGFLTAFLEDNLSDAGRTVTITGFAGALSTRATIEQISIADDQGVWITLNGVVLDWSRSALLRGAVEIDELSAEEILVARAPDTGGDDALPDPEARGFALPELPVSVRVGELSADRIVLDASLLGQPVEGRLLAEVSLAGGEGTMILTLERTDDGPDGSVTLDAGYSNATDVLRIDLAASEAAGGVATTALGIPGAPAVDLTVRGEGPLTDFAAEVRLSSDGAERLAGTVTLQGAEDGAQRFAADLGGDLAPLFLPEYADFFGPQVQLTTAGTRGADGRLDLDALAVRTRALTLDGTLALGADGTPERFALTGRLADPDGGPVLLPAGAPTRIGSADLSLDFDAAADDGWSAVATLRGFDRDGSRADVVALRGSGRILRGQGADGTLAIQATGLAPADADLAAALGERIGGSVSFDLRQGTDALGLPQVRLAGDGYVLEAQGQVSGLAEGIGVSGQATLRATDLARFSGLAGRPLTGAADVTVTGAGSLLGGGFAAEATVEATDLTVSQPQADNLLRGSSRIILSAQRDETGTQVRRLDVTTRGLTAQARGTIATTGSDLAADLDFTDLSVLGPRFGGRLAGQATFRGTPDAGRVTLTAEGTGLALGQPQADSLLRGPSRVVLEAGLSGDAIDLTRLEVTAASLSATAQGRIASEGSDVSARLAFGDLSALGAGYRGALDADARLIGTPTDGRLTLDGTATDLGIGQPEADRLLAGRTALSLSAALADGRVQVDRATLFNPQIAAEASGTVAGGTRTVNLEARLANLGLFLPEFPGPVTLAGTATDQGAGYDLALTGTGPGQIAVRVGGRVAADFGVADLTLAGSAQAGLANAFIGPRSISGPVRFDLALRGALALANLSGRVNLAGGRLSDPGLPFSLDGISASADLSSGQATVTMTTGLTSGGTIAANGTVGLTAPYPARLTADLRQVVARDPRLYETRVNGTATLNGPLTGGAVIGGTLLLNETELRIPDTGFGASGLIEGLEHVDEPAPVRETRRRAGLLGDGAGGADGPGGGAVQPLGLDLTIRAPNRVFVRGRGLDAELGGELLLRGTTDDVQPIGGFELIRGRLDILGTRLVVTQSSLRLEGTFDPLIDILASTTSDGITASVLIAGRATAPEVSFVSTPELPQEEVLARLLFGQGLANLSAFQAAQLAGAVATLAGRGGVGIVGRLRQGFGLDDLDVNTGTGGGTEVTAGKYLSRNLYSEIVVGEDGQSEINLNLDVTDSITLRGTAGGDGGTGLGVFLERDY